MIIPDMDKNKSVYKLKNIAPIYYLNLDEQPEEYWIENMKQYGFEYDVEFTQELKEITKIEGDYSPHFVTTGLFFKKII